VVISGAHAIILSSDAEADRGFFKDVLGLDQNQARKSICPAKTSIPPATPSAAGPRFGLARATPWKQLSRRIPPRFGKIF